MPDSSLLTALGAPVREVRSLTTIAGVPAASAALLSALSVAVMPAPSSRRAVACVAAAVLARASVPTAARSALTPATGA